MDYRLERYSQKEAEKVIEAMSRDFPPPYIFIGVCAHDNATIITKLDKPETYSNLLALQKAFRRHYPAGRHGVVIQLRANPAINQLTITIADSQ